MGDHLNFLSFDPPPPKSSKVHTYWPVHDPLTMQQAMILARCSVDFSSADNSGLKCYYSTLYQSHHRFNVDKAVVLPNDLLQILSYMGGSIAGYVHNEHIPLGVERALIRGVLAVLESLRSQYWHSNALIIKIPSPDWMEKLRDPIIADGGVVNRTLDENHIVPNALLWATMITEIRKTVLEMGTDVHIQLMPQSIRTQVGCMERMGIPDDTVAPRLDHWSGVRGYTDRGPIQWISFWKSEGSVETLEGYTARPWYNHT